MAKAGSASKIKLQSFDDLFGPAEPSAGIGQILEIKISDLHEFPNHPFKVLNDEKMQETVESIQNYGVLEPGIARKRTAGGYEIIAGHRRTFASKLANKETVPFIVRDYTDDEAAIIMVDSNIQRENILPSEKAKAYKMKYDALKHQGKKSDKNTLDEVGEKSGESAKTVQRYIWLARLSNELLELVDNKKIGFIQGVALSFLNNTEQEWVRVILEETGGGISAEQAEKLKNLGKQGDLSLPLVREILSKKKTNERKFIIKGDKIDSFFPPNYTNSDIEEIIIKLLEKWKDEQ